jgi:hypothetical protein
MKKPEVKNLETLSLLLNIYDEMGTRISLKGHATKQIHHAHVSDCGELLNAN